MTFVENDKVEVINSKSKYNGYKGIIESVDPSYPYNIYTLFPEPITYCMVNILDSNNNSIKKVNYSVNSLKLINRDTTDYDKFTDGVIVVYHSDVAIRYGKILEANFNRDQDDGYRLLETIIDGCYTNNKGLGHVSEFRLASHNEVKDYYELLEKSKEDNTDFIVIYSVLEENEDIYNNIYERLGQGFYNKIDINPKNKANNYRVVENYNIMKGNSLKNHINYLCNRDNVIISSIKVYELGKKKNIDISVNMK